MLEIFSEMICRLGQFSQLLYLNVLTGSCWWDGRRLAAGQAGRSRSSSTNSCVLSLQRASPGLRVQQESGRV